MLQYSLAANVDVGRTLLSHLPLTGQKWLQLTLKTHTYHDWAANNFALLRAAFRRRWQKQVRSEASIALDLLTVKGVWQNEDPYEMYLERFLEQMHALDEPLPDPVLCRLFLKGLKPPLKDECALQPVTAEEWVNFTSLLEYAQGRAKVHATRNPRPSLPERKRKYGDVSGAAAETDADESRGRPRAAPSFADRTPGQGGGGQGLGPGKGKGKWGSKGKADKRPYSKVPCVAKGWGIITDEAGAHRYAPGKGKLSPEVKKQLFAARLCFCCRGAAGDGEHRAAQCPWRRELGSK
jgi:hypothetical protein